MGIMRFDLITIFPGLFESFLRESLIGRAIENKAFDVRLFDVRDFTNDTHRVVDDRPFGGGPGMVLKPEPLHGAIKHALDSAPGGSSRVVLLTPAGWPLNQTKVEDYAALDHLILVCGRYEGVDERVSQTLVDEEISVGDYVLSGGEVPAMVLIEAVARLLPGVIGKPESTQEESFSQGLLEYPQYTRPRDFEGLTVPETLLSGDHAAIRAWRLEASLRRTLARRPDMIDRADLSVEENKILEKIKAEELAFNAFED